MSPPSAADPLGGLSRLSLSDLPRRLRRALLRRRRLLAAVLTGIAVASVVHSLSPPPEATVSVLVAAHDLPAGTRLTQDDLLARAFRPNTVPDGLVRDPRGRVIAGPLRRGEPLTLTRLVDPALTETLPGVHAVPVRLPDGAIVALLRVGDRIDLLAADPQDGTTEVISRGTRVLALPAAVANDPLPGRLVLLGLETPEVSVVAGASVTHFLNIAFSR